LLVKSLLFSSPVLLVYRQESIVVATLE
jgi:hypothetical protein